MLRITAALFFVLSLTIAHGQTFDQIQNQVEQHMSQKEWELASEKIEYCLSHFDLEPQTQANLTHNLGYCLLENQDYIGAKFYLETTLQQKYSIHNTKNQDYALTEELLGDLSLRIGQFEKAKLYFLEAQKILNDYTGTFSDENVEALVRIGQFAEMVGDYNHAHDYFDSALYISERIHADRSPDFANVANHIGRIYVKNGDLTNAEKYLLQANGIYLKLGDEYALQYIESLENLAILYQNKGDFTQSEKLLLSIEKEKREL